MEYFEGFTLAPTVLRRWRPTSALGGATDDVLRGHEGHTCIVLGLVADGAEPVRYSIRFANGEEAIAFEDELETV